MNRTVLPPAQRIALGALLAWLLLPLLPLVVWSFARGWYFPKLLPDKWTLANWAHALSPAANVTTALGDTVTVALGATAVALLCGIPAGRALGMHAFRGKAAIEVLVLAPVIVPGIAVALGLHAVFIKLGLANTVTGVMLVHLVPTLPYVVMVMAGVFANFNPDLEAQARSLGAGPWRTWWHVTLPAVLPGIMVAALFAFIVSWGQYILTLLIGGGRVVTLPLLLFNFATAGRNDLAGAIALLYVVPGVLAMVVTARHLTGRGVALATAR